MRFHLTDSGVIEITQMNLLIAEFMRQAPFEADPGRSEAARDRLFSSPMQAEHLDAEFLEDWHDLVRPELEDHFRSANEIVARDLVGLREEPGPVLGADHGDGHHPWFNLRIPVDHLDAWLSCLNQARLVISEKHGFSEEDMEEQLDRSLTGKRNMALFQMHVYGFLQELMLDVIRVSEGESSQFDHFGSEEAEDDDDDEIVDQDRA